jgi:hypothetical protein
MFRYRTRGGHSAKPVDYRGIQQGVGEAWNSRKGEFFAVLMSGEEKPRKLRCQRREVTGRKETWVQCGFCFAFAPLLIEVARWALGFWVVGADMGGKFFVALQLEVAHHFGETCAWGRTRGFELPATFRATKTHKTLLLNPIQLPAHGLCRCSPTLSDCTLVPARRQGTKRRFAAAYCLNAEENRQPVLACRKIKSNGEAYTRQFAWSVGHPT